MITQDHDTGNKGKVHNKASTSFFQPKLTIGPANDMYEQEADAMAERVMRMPDAKNDALFFQPKPIGVTPVQRKCSACEQEEKLQRKEDDESIQTKQISNDQVQRKCSHCEEEEKVQMKEGAAVTGGQIAPSTVHNVINSNGRPLDTGVRSFMESRFGYDFGNVQVHDDSIAYQSTADINALAYTHGDHVVFGPGQYQPHMNSGKQLLAHELTHVIQQKGDSSLLLQRAPAKTDDTCPKNYEEKEVERSRSESGILTDDFYLTADGVVIVDFGIDRGSVKSSVLKNPALIKWLKEVEADTSSQLEIYGYSDCVGAEKHNVDLRRRRAKKVKGILGESAQARTIVVTNAPVSEYFSTDNSNLSNRAVNRSVIIKRVSKTKPEDKITTYNFEAEEVHGDKDKARFICGPDVTKPLVAAIADTDKMFWGWSSDERDDACEDLDGISTAGSAWDIVELHNNAWIHEDFRPVCATVGSKPACGSTVQVDSQCYYAGSVNYVIYGKMCKLCYLHYVQKDDWLNGAFNFTEKAMVDTLRLYKGPYNVGDPFSSSPAPNYDKSRQWARQGYKGWPATGMIPKGDRNNCTPYCPTPFRGKFNVHWTPNQVLETTRRFAR